MQRKKQPRSRKASPRASRKFRFIAFDKGDYSVGIHPSWEEIFITVDYPNEGGDFLEDIEKPLKEALKKTGYYDDIYTEEEAESEEWLAEHEENC